jgi:sortase B
MQGVNSVLNFLVLVVIVVLLVFAAYALWDARQLYQAADSANYAVYKPTEQNKGKTFKELQALNPEVFAWLTVFGTHIDYPVVQGHDNMKYVNTNAEGLYSLTGAIFLDCGNSRDFSDFNSLLYGHHMEKKAMFGEIGSFARKQVFDTCRYGNLYFDGNDHGLEFFAFVHTDAYDQALFSAKVKGAEAQQDYLSDLLAKALYTRSISVLAEDRFILLATCSSSTTNGRDILVGRISDEVFKDTLQESAVAGGAELLSTGKNCGPDAQALLLTPLLIGFLTIFLTVGTLVHISLKERKRQEQTGHEDDE